MNKFENAKKFFEACDQPAGWDACKAYVASGAPFIAQSEPLVDIKTVEDYCNWMHGFGTVTVPGAHYKLHSSAFDEATNTAVFVATYHARHTGEGGPVPPTNKETHTDYVYTLQMNDEGKVTQMTKIWNSTWALRELGWTD